MEIDGGYPSESDAHAHPIGRGGKLIDYTGGGADPLNDSRLSIMRKLNAKAAKQARFRIF